MRSITGIILFLLALLPAAAQQTVFSTEVDTNRIRIGEQFRLMMHGEVPEGGGFEWPVLPDTISGLEQVRVGKVDTARSNGSWIIRQEILYTSFDSGYVAVPPLALLAGGDSVSSPAIAIGVDFPETAEGEEMYDIKQPLEAPANWWPIVITALAVLILAAVIYFIIRYLRKRKGAGKVSPEQMLSPYEYAKLQMKDIEREKLWQNGKVKEYYSRLTDVMRLYMERQMQVNAMESTADEVVEQVNTLQIQRDLKEKVRKLMHLSVLVKYAREHPGPARHEEAMATVREFLEATKPRESEDEASDKDKLE